MLHQHFKQCNLEMHKFDGSSEVFDVTLQGIEEYLSTIQPVVNKMVIEGYVEEDAPDKPIFPKLGLYNSIEWKGFWYRNKKHLLDTEKITGKEFECVGSIEGSYKEFRLKLKRYREAKQFKMRRLRGRDWGDGVFGTIKGIERAYGMCHGTLWHRIRTEGMPMKEALSLPKGRVDEYWSINNKWYNKKHLCSSLGINQGVVTTRMQRGIPLIYALVKEQYSVTLYKRSIFNLNGNLYWWGDFRALFGETRAISAILDKYGCVGAWLQEKSFITKHDYFEEIVFEKQDSY